MIKCSIFLSVSWGSEGNKLFYVSIIGYNYIFIDEFSYIIFYNAVDFLLNFDKVLEKKTL